MPPRDRATKLVQDDPQIEDDQAVETTSGPGEGDDAAPAKAARKRPRATRVARTDGMAPGGENGTSVDDASAGDGASAAPPARPRRRKPRGYSTKLALPVIVSD